jgi:hypothetical protein
MSWLILFDERQQKEIEFCQVYKQDFGHGTDGHNVKMIIARMAEMLFDIEKVILTDYESDDGYKFKVDEISAILNECLKDVEACIYGKRGSEKPMNINEQAKDEFERLTRELIKWLNDYWHPHTKIIIDSTSAELVEDINSYTTEDFLKD